METRTDEVGASEFRVDAKTDKSGFDPYSSRLLVGTPTLGTIRMEWHNARVGLIIPVNWSMVRISEFMGGYAPLGFLVSDAQNIIVDHAVKGDFEWLLLYEDDVLPSMNALVILNKYMTDAEYPVVSGLYYTKSRPSDPLIFRGRGNGVYNKFKKGDLVWGDGAPTGFLLIHTSILRAMWEDCEEYVVKNRTIRRMFRFPRDYWQDPETGHFRTLVGTSDLDWCTRAKEGGYFKKAGWPNIQRRKYPILIDTNIFCHHIDPKGNIYP